MKIKLFTFIVLVVLISSTVQAQSKLNLFLKPSDTLNVDRKKTVIISETLLFSATLIGLQSYWYNDYPRSNFHFINDNNEWEQMDKAGHIYASYQIGSLGRDALKWSGLSKKNQLIYGASLGFVFLSAVEVLDGFSANWGASSGDILANATGTAIYVSQDLLWNEQRIIPKFSFHTTQYPEFRSDVLGNSLNEQILKDYNGQTYWLSTNLFSFSKKSKLPKWLNVAFGYGAEGMLGGFSNQKGTVLHPEIVRTRQFYLSLDADLTKIETKSPLLKTIFSIVNLMKIPAPTIEINTLGEVEFYPFYF